jgi:DNA modification methylase
LPEASIDAVIADPPYSSGGRTHEEKNRDVRDKDLAAHTAP